MLVVAYEPGVHVEVGEKLAGNARIFGGNEMRFPEYAEGASRDVLQVTDRSGDKIEGAHAGIVSSGKAGEL